MMVNNRKSKYHPESKIMEQTENIKSHPWTARLDYIASLEAGWLDGSDATISDEAIARASSLLEALYPDGYNGQLPSALLPSIFPDENGVVIEWGTPKFLISIEVQDTVYEGYFVDIQEKKNDEEFIVGDLEAVLVFIQAKLPLLTNHS